MADLGAAWLGLAGVGLGACITQVSDAIRWRRERAERLRERREAALLDIIAHSTAVLTAAGRVGDAVGGRPIRKVEDLYHVDAAVVLVTQAVDVLRVLGPSSLVTPVLVLSDRTVDIRAELVAGRELDEAGRRLFDAKAALMNAALAEGLAHGGVQTHRREELEA